MQRVERQMMVVGVAAGQVSRVFVELEIEMAQGAAFRIVRGASAADALGRRGFHHARQPLTKP